MKKYLSACFLALLFSALFSIVSIADDPPPPPGGSTGAGDGTGGAIGSRNGATGAPIDRKTLPLILVLIASSGFGGYILYKRAKAEVNS